MSVGTFKMGFYPLFKNHMKNLHFSISAILDCKLWPSWANSQMSPDCFEIIVPNLPYKPMSCFYH